MKKIEVTTRRTIAQDWVYVIEVPDDFSSYGKVHLDDQPTHDMVVESCLDQYGYCLDNDFIEDERILNVRGEWLNVTDLEEE